MLTGLLIFIVISWIHLAEWEHGKGDRVGSGKWGADTIAAITKRLNEVGHEGNCRKRKVGTAILDSSGEVLAAAANGTPRGMPRCDAGGCVRCAASGTFPHGVAYDLCICLHAEEAVLVSAMRDRINVSGLVMATSYQPCFMCAKLIVASGIDGVLYDDPWQVPEEQAQLPGLRADYAALWAQLPGGCEPLASLLD
jgi:dCMP deaminase